MNSSQVKRPGKHSDEVLHVALGDPPDAVRPGGAGHDGLSIRADVDQTYKKEIIRIMN